MADTVAIALVGALILTLTLVPVLCALWFKKSVHERENKPFQWILRKYAVWLDWCMDRPRTTLVLAGVIFVATLLLIPFIGGEFMPHLDEGAMWIRATMPYTVSFETASRFSPQVRDILMKYPMVTDVGSELGRPDDGTDPTGFFNDEFYVGLKPYGDAAWKTGSIHSKAALQADIERQLDTFPGVIFNFTQPAEDAVDEAASRARWRSRSTDLT
jgi:cobalt-zinc-cadmium resistance protein CzcA